MRERVNHRGPGVFFFEHRIRSCFFSPAAAWDSNAIEIWEGFSGSSHLNEWRPLSESNLMVAFLSGCSQHHESCLAVVEKTNFPSTKIFFFPENRLCSNSTSQGGDLVGAKTGLSRFYHWSIYKSINWYAKNTKNSSTYAFIHRLICHTQVSPIVTFNSVASKKKVQAWRNFEDFMCRPMWSTWYCGDRIPQNTASSIPLSGWFPPNSLEFFSKLLPQLDGVTTLMFSQHRITREFSEQLHQVWWILISQKT